MSQQLTTSHRKDEFIEHLLRLKDHLQGVLYECSCLQEGGWVPSCNSLTIDLLKLADESASNTRDIEEALRQLGIEEQHVL